MRVEAGVSTVMVKGGEVLYIEHASDRSYTLHVIAEPIAVAFVPVLVFRRFSSLCGYLRDIIVRRPLSFALNTTWS